MDSEPSALPLHAYHKFCRSAHCGPFLRLSAAGTPTQIYDVAEGVSPVGALHAKNAESRAPAFGRRAGDSASLAKDLQSDTILASCGRPCCMPSRLWRPQGRTSALKEREWESSAPDGATPRARRVTASSARAKSATFACSTKSTLTPRPARHSPRLTRLYSSALVGAQSRA